MNLADALLHPDEYDGEAIIQPWLPIIGNGFSVLHVTVFGNFFLIDTSGQVWLLDSWAGQLHGVSRSYEEFKTQVGTNPEFFSSWFLVEFIEALNSAGLCRNKGQVFSPVVSPGLGGSLAPENFSLAPLRAYVACSAGEIMALHQGANQ